MTGQEIDLRKPLRVLLQYFRIDGPVTVLGDGFLCLVAEEKLQVGLGYRVLSFGVKTLASTHATLGSAQMLTGG